ncbi:TetR/AcrR family transcriptional regulator [Gordonia sp. ABSL11-1]|uniref:TetR/AcrR family transcriptional regulator n=1 Tax=Gordonia sp. ABSL11-1 TaxID=3053924 RepID=UPI0025737EB8|nr:TetR/AcrR family transcriptional regulator [Gordonia sp. ABSL11-1]MDL9945463.1 TetR/AcrR family transcriptional regulator [Gordonia sp. ABSL11-1]
MKVNRRTQAERTAATRSALIGAGRTLFGEHGYAAVGTQTIVDAAGVTRGALYHQFDDKKGLFTAVYDQVEQDITAEVAERVGELALADPVAALKAGVRVFLERVTDPAVHQISLVDAPSVLGWSEWRARGEEFGFALIEGILQAAIAVGQIENQPVRPIAHVAIGALDESALYVSAADDKDVATAEVLVVLDRIIDSFVG